MPVTRAPNTVRGLLGAIMLLLEGSVEFEGAVGRREAAREARELLASLMGVRPGDVSRASDAPVPEALEARALAAAERRARGEPLAYCVGSVAFRELVLNVDRRVLIPRPETEVVVGEALALAATTPGGIAVDIGTGSGAIALSLATEGCFERVIATDISADALDVARDNAARVAAACPIEFRLGADFAPLEGVRARVLVSNPPYIARDEADSLPDSVRDWEPPVALFADDRGMARYDALLAGAPDHLEAGGWLVLEVDARRARETAQRATRDGRYSALRLVRDLAGRERVLVARCSNDDSTQ